MEDLVYSAGYADEHFLSFVTTDDKIAGFLRLSIPIDGAPTIDVADTEGSAIIREVHVWVSHWPLVRKTRVPRSI